MGSQAHLIRREFRHDHCGFICRRADGMVVTGQLLDSDSEPKILWRICAGARPSCDAMFGQDHARGPFPCSKLPHSLQWEVWASKAHFGPVNRLIGPVGPIAWQWSKQAGSHQREGLCSGLGRCWHRISNVGPPLADGARPLPARGHVEDQSRHGWQREVSMKVEPHFRDMRLMPTGRTHFHPKAFSFRCLGCSGVQVFRCLGVQVFRCSGVQVFRCLGV